MIIKHHNSVDFQHSANSHWVLVICILAAFQRFLQDDLGMLALSQPASTSSFMGHWHNYSLLLHLTSTGGLGQMPLPPLNIHMKLCYILYWIFYTCQNCLHLHTCLFLFMFLILCGSREYPYSCHGRWLEIPKGGGGGGSLRPNF